MSSQNAVDMERMKHQRNTKLPTWPMWYAVVNHCKLNYNVSVHENNARADVLNLQNWPPTHINPIITIVT